MLVHALARSRKLRMLLSCWVTLSLGRLIGATARTYRADNLSSNQYPGSLHCMAGLTLWGHACSTVHPFY